MNPLTREEIYKNLIGVTGTNLTGISGGYRTPDRVLESVNEQIQTLIQEGKINSEEEIYNSIIDLGSGEEPRIPNFKKIQKYVGVDITFENKKYNIINEDMILFLRKQKDKSANIYLGAITDDILFYHTKDFSFEDRYIYELKKQVERVAKDYIIITGVRDFLLEFEGFEKLSKHIEIWKRK